MPGSVATGGDVGDLEETGKARICGQDLFADGVEHFGLDAGLLGGGDGGGELFNGEASGESSGFWLASCLTCSRVFSRRYLGGTRLSSTPMDMLAVTWSKALGIAWRRAIQSS